MDISYVAFKELYANCKNEEARIHTLFNINKDYLLNTPLQSVKEKEFAAILIGKGCLTEEFMYNLFKYSDYRIFIPLYPSDFKNTKGLFSERVVKKIFERRNVFRGEGTEIQQYFKMKVKEALRKNKKLRHELYADKNVQAILFDEPDMLIGDGLPLDFQKKILFDKAIHSLKNKIEIDVSLQVKFINRYKSCYYIIDAMQELRSFCSNCVFSEECVKHLIDNKVQIEKEGDAILSLFRNHLISFDVAALFERKSLGDLVLEGI